MLKNKALTNLFSSGLQAIAVQVLGSFFFYFISVYLSKDSFGVISWMNAVSLFLTTFLGFGLEQVVVRRIAASNRSDWSAAAFLTHSVVGFSITLLILFILNGLLKSQAGIYKFLPWFFVAQGLIYIGSPLKQFLNAKERFTPYGIIAVISNVCKIVAAFILLQSHQLDINTVVIILIGTAGFELCCLLIYIITKTTFSFKLHFKAYKKLLKESSAQYLSVIFDMSLSRIDWILLGIMSTNLILADYSFAYRAFELARLPLFIIAPIILPRLARLMSSAIKPGAEQQQHIHSFNAIEMFFAGLIPLMLNILWIPLVTLITKGKYGDANSIQFLVLSACIPLLFFVNLLWSLSFSAKKYKSVSTITIVCAVTNLLLNLVLISKFGGLGAAVAFFITIMLQGILYYRLVAKEIMRISLLPLGVFFVASVAIYLGVTRLHVHFMIQLLIGIVLYLLIAAISGQLNRQHIRNFKQLLSK